MTSSNNMQFLENFYTFLQENDWQEGIEIYQSGKVFDFVQYENLYSGKIKIPNDPTQEVRLKIHPNGKIILWLECTCRKNRTYNRYCEHIVAFLMHLGHEKKTLFANLDSKMAFAIPKHRNMPSRNEAVPQEKKNEKKQGLLEQLKGSILRADFLAATFGLRIKIEIKNGQTANYDLDIDQAAVFLASNPQFKNKKNKQAQLLEVVTNSVILGTRFHTIGNERVRSERVATFAIDTAHIKSFSKHKYFANAALLNPSANESNQAGSFLFFPFKEVQSACGKTHIYLPNIGYCPLERKTNSLWLEEPLQKTFRDDSIAELLESGFGEFCDQGPVWLDMELFSSSIIKNPELKEIRVTSEKGGWFFLDPSYKQEQNSLPMIEMILQARNNKRKYIKSGNQWVQIPEFVRKNKWEIDAASQKIKVDTLGLIRLKAAGGEFDRLVGSKQILDTIRQRTEFDPAIEIPSLSASKLKLRQYQNEGFKWFWWLYTNQIHGLLADDMGLGKTHQAMALLTAIQKSELDKGNSHVNFLVVCPTSVLDHWNDKIIEFAPNLQPLLYHGSLRHSYLKDFRKDHKLLITSYGVLLRDIKSLEEINWDSVILDEAHYVKNNNTNTYKAACRLNSRIRICLTGTPLENRLSELKNLFDFLVPGYMGSDDYFRRNFVTPIESKDAQAEMALQRLIYPFKLRRKKTEVLDDLPAKIEDLRYCSLSPDQSRLYREILDVRARPVIAQLRDENQKVQYLHVFTVLQLLKQVCNHPALLVNGSNYEDYESGKFELFKEILSESLDSGQKVVVFSQYVKMVQLLKNYCEKQNIPAVSLTGQSRKRGELIKEFQENDKVKVFIGSLLAGGLGIDLTAASVVIHYDRWWNATKENQATDRVHRIGQNKHVHVFKLVTKGTLEERIDSIIERKSDIFNKFLENDEEVFSKMSRQDLLELLV